MVDVIKDVAIALILAGVCAICGYILKTRKQNILKIVTDLIQNAEESVTGSNMGVKKKEKVIAQLNAMGIKVNDWLDKEIDSIVAYLNSQSGWFVSEAQDAISDKDSE